MDQANGSPTPMVTSSNLSQHIGCAIKNESEYRSIMGALQYVVITRLDITFAVNKVCQFMHRPLDQHFKAVKHILRYLQSTMDYGLHFTTAANLDLVGYSDANWGTDVDDRRSTTGFFVFLGGNPVAWGSKKQQIVSKSTAEAIYRGLAYTVTEVVWLESLLSELHVSTSRKAIVWCDNSGAIAISANPVLHSKFKHVELDLFFVREKIAARKLSVGHIPTQEQVADVFTKRFSHYFMTITLTCHLLAMIRWNGCSLIFCRNIGLPVLNSHAINSSIHIRYPPSSIAVKWQPPSIGWKKLNTDGSAIGNPGRAGAGALIRDHDYIWVKGCYRFIPTANNIEVELWTLRNGLTLAVDLNLSMLWTLIPNTRVKHVFREGNRSVDALTNLEGRSFCNQPHEAILSTVLAEAWDLLFGVVFCRILNLVLCYRGLSFF
ncbi:hypothetical protein CXB51_005284 [Gossypium anomalum]|uniref:RNase H type-1 domain-containing protein n=1 Tax=Gossypium anomalum TaxID=47600 RepID=A0A8J5ZFK2_9ROSI|nr:hypothetical protein CXB51_005284 [Gossypium anomalum]